MKICPKCQQTYTDEKLNFCLTDGSVLQQSGGDALPETVFVNPPPTSPNQSYGNQQPSFGGQPPPFGGQPQNAWNNQQQQNFSQPPRPPKSSKAWLWVVGILGALVLLCGGGGLLGLLLYKSSENTNVNTAYTTPTPSVSPTVASNVTKYDMALWKPAVNEFATTTFAGGKYTIEVTKPNFYYVVITNPSPKTKDEFETQNVTTRLTVSNRDAKPVKYGFGLVVHSDTTPLTQDYAFVIDSENQKYRILHHSLKIEKELTKWTTSTAIKKGSGENVLEVRDKGSAMQFYINGQFVKTVTDEDDNTDGIAGIYSSENIPIEFSNLQTEK